MKKTNIKNKAKKMISKRRYLQQRNSQISLEYLILVGFVTLAIIPLILIYITFSQESGAEISAAQLNQLGHKIVGAAESVYYLGEPSQTTLVATIPSGIQAVNISGNELMFRLKTARGISDIAVYSTVNISGTLPVEAGTYRVVIIASSSGVNITYN